MAADLQSALQAGAIGMSTGVYYPPAQSATAEELIAVGASLQSAGGMVAMHIRDEGDAITAVLREALYVGHALGITTVLSHHKLMGRANHGRSVETPRLMQPHPRLWGTFPRVLGRYVREQRLLSLDLAIHKMTGLSARRFGLKGRGVLAPGNFADVVILDEHRVTDRATYQQPKQLSTGIDAVYVNGVLACEQGHSVHHHAGRVLRRS